MPSTLRPTDDQQQQRKAHDAATLLLAEVDRARRLKLFGEVAVTIKLQNGTIGQYETLVRQTHK